MNNQQSDTRTDGAIQIIDQTESITALGLGIWLAAIVKITSAVFCKSAEL